MTSASIAGHGFTSEINSEHRAAEVKDKVLHSHLELHYSRRRGGDQFCVYVADRVMLFTLSGGAGAAI